MRRVFWMAVGAAGGIWAYQRGAEALERARERGVVGNVVAASTLAGKVAATSARLVLAASAQGAALAERLAPPDAAAPAGRVGGTGSRPAAGAHHREMRR